MDYLKKKMMAPAWGAKFIPQETGLAFFVNQNLEESLENVEDGVNILRPLAAGPKDEALLEQYRKGAKDLMQQFGGQYTSGVWLNSDSSLGGVVVAKIKDPEQAQKAFGKFWSQFGKGLLKFVQKMVRKEFSEKLPGFEVKLAFKANALKVAGTRGDVVEVSLNWPRVKDRRQREKIALVKKALHKLLGPKLSFAMVYVGDAFLATFGNGQKKRMAKLISIAKGGKGEGLEKTLESIHQDRQFIMFFYIPVETLAEQVLRVVNEFTELSSAFNQAAQRMLPAPGKSVPLSGMLHKDGGTLKMDLRLSAEAVRMVARLVMAQFGHIGP